MAKKVTRKTTRKAESLRSFDVYQQDDGALVVLPAGDEPSDNEEAVWSGEAVDERDAIAEARHSSKHLKNAAAANPAHDPSLPDRVRAEAEAATNERLGITVPAKAKRGVKKSAKRGVKKVKAKAKRKAARR